MRKKTKKQLKISIDIILFNLMNYSIINKSKYIEWLIYQDLKRNRAENIDDIII